MILYELLLRDLTIEFIEKKAVSVKSENSIDPEALTTIFMLVKQKKKQINLDIR